MLSWTYMDFFGNNSSSIGSKHDEDIGT